MNQKGFKLNLLNLLIRLRSATKTQNWLRNWIQTNDLEVNNFLLYRWLSRIIQECYKTYLENKYKVRWVCTQITKGWL